MIFAEPDCQAVPPVLNRTQERVHRILEKSRQPLTAYAILDQLRKQTKATPPTVYRALGRLIACGFVHRIESLHACVACAGHSHPGVAAFAICSNCGSVEELTDPRISRRLQAWSRSHAFQLQDTAIEI